MKKLKDKKIMIIKYSEGGGTDEDGFPIPGGWQKIHDGKLWAYYRQLSVQEVSASSAIFTVDDSVFVVNWRNDITTDMIIAYNGKHYSIIKIDGFEGYKDDITIYARSSGVITDAPL